MENKLQVFDFNEQQVRTVTINDEPYFVGKDVATILGYKRTADALKAHVDDEDKLTRCFADSGQSRKMKVINESGLYSLILSSKLPTAKEFKHWVTSEVLPSIRKHGVYMTDEKAYDITHDQSGAVLADLLQQAADQLKAKDIQIEEMKPKALFADAVSASDTPILIGELAKILKQNGIEIGQNRLFAWLRDKGYLISRNGTDYNTPTQKSMELGLFKIKERTRVSSDGSVKITKTSMVTGKGQQYFVNKFLGEKSSVK